MDAVTIDAMIVGAVRAERERIKHRLETQREIQQCVEEG
jgi:hypothetical protein